MMIFKSDLLRKIRKLDSENSILRQIIRDLQLEVDKLKEDYLNGNVCPSVYEYVSDIHIRDVLKELLSHLNLKIKRVERTNVQIETLHLNRPEVK